jgi:hypothetical protein
MRSMMYARTISEEEAKEGYFIVVKDMLAFFPIPGTEFELEHGASWRTAKVESHLCECRGPEKPHEHYFVRWNGLHCGDRLILRKHSDKPNRYIVSIRSVIAQEAFCG